MGILESKALALEMFPDGHYLIRLSPKSKYGLKAQSHIQAKEM